MVIPFSVLFSVFGMGVALMDLQIRLSGQVKDQIRGIHGNIKDLNGRIERVEERLSVRIDQVRNELNGHINQVSGEVKELRFPWNWWTHLAAEP
ncbi:hypothetical protein [Candidatus Synechococcus spongiarum]|uniref:Uncharacterized protein n=1 Tax=Candidatus Synechococcus spongiarum TaxID=431041 RepID=A0A170TGA3_9SYNE|nr:hypothetical protein [Candidatus Synechococcus spongiarum]CZB23159.1 hypothetical protein FLM9_1566 [Candidatus Synechococcus spongiarum]